MKRIHVDWFSVAFWSAAYVFLGILVFYFAILSGKWYLIALSIVVYVLNLILLSYAKKQDF